MILINVKKIIFVYTLFIYYYNTIFFFYRFKHDDRFTGVDFFLIFFPFSILLRVLASLFFTASVFNLNSLRALAYNIIYYKNIYSRMQFLFYNND